MKLLPLFAPRSLVLVGSLLVALAGCSSDSAAQRCVASDDAEVCVTAVDGRLELDASGLEPASTVTMSTLEHGPAEFTVTADGSIGGQGSLIAAPGQFEGVVTVAATTSDGGDLTVELTFQ